MDIKKMSVLELKALLFDIDQNMKQQQTNYQQVGLELKNKIEEETNKKENVQPKSK